MIEWFKKHFIPHDENDHRPHFLHNQNTRTILILVLAFELLLFILPTLTFVGRTSNSNLATVLPGVLSELTNDERRENNVAELVVDPLLTEAAEMKAKDMAEKGYFAHTSPEGKTPWYWLDEVGYTYDYAGENLAINFNDSKDVTEAWMHSPTHRANIVKGSYTAVGTGIAVGKFEGQRTIFVAQVYANPKPVVKTEEPLAAFQPKTAIAAEVEKAVVQTNIQSMPTTERATVTSSGKNNLLKNSSTQEPSDIEKIVASPRHASNMVFLAIAGVMVLALIFNILIKINVQHPDLITNGVFVVATVLAIMLVNNFVGHKDIGISQGMDYSEASVISSHVI